MPAVVETKTAAPAPVIAEPEPSVDVSNKVVDSPEVNATDAPNAANDINSHLEPISDDELNDSVAKEATDADETVAETAMENGTDSACSSNATSKSSSQIKLKYEYPEGILCYLKLHESFALVIFYKIFFLSLKDDFLLGS